MSVAKKIRTGTTYAFPRTLRNQRALCATCSTSGKAASSRTDPSMCDFFWQLVPADPLAHVRAELPLHRFGRLHGQLQQAPGLGDGLVAAVVRDQRGTVPHHPQSAPSSLPKRPVSIDAWAPPPRGSAASRWTISRRSFSFSSTICSFDSSTSTASIVSGWRSNEGRKSSTWHMLSLSTMTSMGRPEGAVKYIWRSPLRLLNLRSGSQPAPSRYSATFLRCLVTQAKSMSWSRRSRGGKSGHSTRTASPPRSLSPSEAPAAPRASARASGSGSSAGEGAPAAPGVVVPNLPYLAVGTRGGTARPNTAQRVCHDRP